VLHNYELGIVITTVDLYVDGLYISCNWGMIGHFEDQVMKWFWIHDLGSVSFELDRNNQWN